MRQNPSAAFLFCCHFYIYFVILFIKFKFNYLINGNILLNLCLVDRALGAGGRIQEGIIYKVTLAEEAVINLFLELHHVPRAA
jgi:hypothetical protein